MILFKACPRCHGDLQLRADVYGGPPELCCFQCGGTVATKRMVMPALGAAGVTITDAPALPALPITRQFRRHYARMGAHSWERTNPRDVVPPVADR